MLSPIERNYGDRFAAFVSGCLLADGGAGTGTADLWATYAGIRTLKWVGRLPAGPRHAKTVDYLLSRRNPDGGFAWQRGLASDVWATFYSTQALSDLGHPVDALGELGGWLADTQNPDGGFGMRPGQASEVWATYYACRLWREIVGRSVPNAGRLATWLMQLQCTGGGLTWTPGHREADVRAAYYAVQARAAAEIHEPTWNQSALFAWLRAMQTAGGGFRFSDGASPCLWATFRAARAMQTLGCAPSDRKGCVSWIERQLRTSGFVRWAPYAVSDVWANFTGVGALMSLGRSLTRREKRIVETSILRCFTDEGGLTYRDVASASDALTTAAVLITDVLLECLESQMPGLCNWLKAAHMPWEDGVMYMPARGAEIRCTLWALSALRLAGTTLKDTDRIVRWVAELQNPDGGFGHWLGRGSDIASSAAAIAILQGLGRAGDSAIDRDRLRNFVSSCTREEGAAAVPGGAVCTSATAQAARLWMSLGVAEEARRLGQTLAAFELLAGFREDRHQPPNLYTTYQCHLTFQMLGRSQASAGLHRFLSKLSTSNGIAWTPLGSQRQDALAIPLFVLLMRKSARPSFELIDLIL